MITGKTIVEVITADINNLTDDLNEDHSIRLYSRGGHFNKDQMIPVYFMLISGFDNSDDYNNFLFGLRDDIKRKGRPLAFIDTPLNGASGSELAVLSGIDAANSTEIISALCMQLNIRASSGRTQIAQKALGDLLLSEGNGNIGTVGADLVSKMNLIANAIGAGESENIPVIMYYGIPTAQDVLFLCYAQKCGFDVLCISSDKSVEAAFESCPYAEKMQKISFPNSRPNAPFPEKMVKAKIATVAYNAERELDDMLYSGDTMFRDRQFTKMDSAVLKTTFDEISILWEQPAKYRTGFSVRGDRVTVPTIFAKVNGVKGGRIKDYWTMIDEMLTPESIYRVKAPAYKRPAINVARLYAPFHNGKSINTAALKTSQLNKYGFLSDGLQELIFEKIQAVINDGMLKMDSEAELVDYVMYVGLNLDRSVLRLLQTYDFTKEVPKFVVVDTIEEPFSKLECIQLLMFSYLGFDVIVFSPSGYRDIEAFVSDDAFETHNNGEFMYNLSAPNLKIPKEPRVKKQKGGLLKNLFKKGR